MLKKLRKDFFLQTRFLWVSTKRRGVC